MAEGSANANLPAEISRRVRIQYERFPYPPGSWLKIPLLEQSLSLAFESGARFAYADLPPSRGIRILVAGCGTLEPLVVAQQNPHASEIVAVDLSDASLATLTKRWKVYRAATFWSKRPHLRTVCADLGEWQGGEFDYIIASNVLHHTADPARVFARLAGMLRVGGMLRMVTYPRQSRLWMRQTAEWFRTKGLHAGRPGLRTLAGQAIMELPAVHPIRSSYRAQPEILTQTGLVDAFFHAQERPLSPLEWGTLGTAAGLECVAEAQAPAARSEFLNAVAPELLEWPRFAKLEVMDLLLELTHNPVLWWVKRAAHPRNSALPLLPALADLPVDPGPERVTSRVFYEMRHAIVRVDQLLRAMGAPAELTARVLIDRLRMQIGAHAFPGLSLTEYEWEQIQGVRTRPWDHARWIEWESRGSRRQGFARGAPLPGRTAAEQVDWLQAVYGPRAPQFEVKW